MGTKVPSERASCPRGMYCGAGEMGTDASWKSMENDRRCCAVCGESRMHGAQRGDEETYRKATRLVPTQLECAHLSFSWGDEVIIQPWGVVEHTEPRTDQASLTASAPSGWAVREYRAWVQQHCERRKRCDFVAVVENTAA